MTLSRRNSFFFFCFFRRKKAVQIGERDVSRTVTEDSVGT